MLLLVGVLPVVEGAFVAGLVVAAAAADGAEEAVVRDLEAVTLVEVETAAACWAELLLPDAPPELPGLEHGFKMFPFATTPGILTESRVAGSLIWPNHDRSVH